MKLHKIKINKGYTILETMVAISIFLVVVLAGMNAIFNANLVSHKSEDVRSIVDNMNFILEEMSRNIRTGYNYHCVDANNNSFTNLDTPSSCSLGGAIAFEETSGDPNNPLDQWVYKIESTNGGKTYNLLKSTDSGASFVQLNPSQVALHSNLGEGVSGFRVLGAESPDAIPSNTQQPLVVIRLIGEIRYNDKVSPFSLQTAVSQRLVDVGQ
jgi:prepilin-type N-terminal cleavage/methylation domain-containing protein